jgi:hypothetical protein
MSDNRMNLPCGCVTRPGTTEYEVECAAHRRRPCPGCGQDERDSAPILCGRPRLHNEFAGVAAPLTGGSGTESDSAPTQNDPSAGSA